MIYIAESEFERQISLLQLVSRLAGPSLFVTWAHLGSKTKSLAGVSVGSGVHGLRPVTTYGSGTQMAYGPSTEPTSFTDTVANELLRKKAKVIRCCDSIALYRSTDIDWFACCIHHEKTCLVKDDSLLPQLEACGYSANTKTPSWW